MINVPHFKTTQGKFAMSFVGSDCWNRLPSGIRLENRRSAFRNSMMQLLLEDT